MQVNHQFSSTLIVNQDMTEPTNVSVAGGFACVFSSKCPGKDTANEDAAAVIPFDDQSAVLAVADGLGGSAVGELASRLAVESLKSAVEDARGSETMLRTAIINGFDRANSKVRELGVGAATTLAAVEITDQYMRPFHVGDSTILIVGGRGKLKFQSISHSPVGYGMEAGFLNEAEALSHEERHVVSNVLGSQDMRIDIGPTIKSRVRDRLLLATDGLADNLKQSELCSRITRGRVDSAVRGLISIASQRMTQPTDEEPSKPDDLTLMCFQRS